MGRGKAEWVQAKPWCQSMAEASPAPTFVLDRERTIHVANGAACRLFGEEREELLGRPLKTLLPDLTKDELERAEPLRRRLVLRRGSGALSLELRWTPLDTEGAWFACCVIPEEEPQAPPDTPAADSAQELLRFRTVAESVPHMVWTCRADGQCDYLSPQWAAYTGLPAESQLGDGWLERLHPEDAANVRSRWAHAAALAETFDTEFRIRRHDGVYRWFKTRAVRIEDATTGRVKWLGTNTDIQDLRDAEEASGRLNRELEVRVRARTLQLQEAQRALETRTVQLQTAQRIAHVGSWEFDVCSGEVRWSEELFHIFGMSSWAEVPNFSDQASLFSPESWERLQTAVEHSICSGEGYELVLTVIRADGTPRTGVARAETIRDSSGQIAQLVGTFQDITDRERASQRLSQLSERLQLATQAARIGVWDWDIPNNQLVWDETMLQLYGVEPERFTGGYDAWHSALHPDDVEPTEAALRRAIEGTGDFYCAFRIRCPDGTERYLQAAAAVHRDPVSGEALRLVGVNWDITDKRVAELELLKSRQFTQGMLEHAGSAFIAADREGTITLFNRAAEELLGYRAAEVVGKETPSIWHVPEEVEARRQGLEVELGVPIENRFDVFVAKARQRRVADANEWTYLTKDGRAVPVLLTVTCLWDERDEVFAYLGVAVDLGHRKQHERELLALNQLLEERTAQAESASRAKSDFVANMSHEIRTPLSAITGIVYLLSKTVLSSDQESLLRTLDRSAKTLLGMINDILDLSKVEAQQLTLEEAPFSLLRLIDELSGLMAAYALDKNLELVINVDPNVPERLLGDRLRLMQVLHNLVSNAIKFTDEGSVIVEVRALEEPSAHDWLRFEVRDTGPGIEEAELCCLFERFTQAHQGKGRSLGGTGLGLAIVKELVGLMGGRLGADSEPDHGSTFWCEIPLSCLLDEVQDDREKRHRDVLIVDDHLAQRAALAAHAQRFGWTVDVATSGREALQRCASKIAAGHPYDAVVLDRKMPDMDGLAILRAIHESADPRGRRPALVMTTASDLDELRRQPESNLADVLLNKPISPNNLFDAVTAPVASRSGETGPLDTHPERDSLQLAGARLLVVDDNEVNREIARRLLHLEGATVDVAAGGRQALAMVPSEVSPAYDAILMDIQMPEMDGVEAVQSLRRTWTSDELPVVAVTAGALASERRRALNAGMNAFVSKPFEPASLIATLRKYVTRRAEGRVFAIAKEENPPDPHAWPEVLGLDVEGARTRVGGDVSLFRALLASMVTDLDQLTRVLTRPSTARRRDPLAAQLHKLKGVTGTLGASELHRLTSRAEDALRAGDDAVFDDTAGRLLEEALRVIRSAERVVAEPAGVERAPSHGNASVSKLERELRDQSLHAQATFAALSPRLLVALGPSDHARLKTAIQRLEFGTALSVVQQLNHAEPATT